MVGCAALSLLFPNVLALFPPTQPVAAAPIIRWAYYVTYAKDSFTALQANVGALSMVSPYYFALQADGTVKNFEEADTNAMLRAARVKIIPMVKNEAHNADFTAQIATPEARDKLAATIADLVVPRNYDGINIDFEDIRPEDRPLLTDTIRGSPRRFGPPANWLRRRLSARRRTRRAATAGRSITPPSRRRWTFAMSWPTTTTTQAANAGPVAPIGWVRDVTTSRRADLRRGQGAARYAAVWL